MNETSTIETPARKQAAPVTCCDAIERAECCEPERAGELLLAAGGDRFGRAADVGSGRDPVPLHPSRRLTEPAWSELHERLHAFVARRVPDRAAVDDLAQEILLRLYTHIGRLREQERLDAWAYQIARNVIADYWRDRAAHRELPLDQR